ncbi:MAG: respiratory nitrate reductase subunit gamma [Chloroflexota bacterium]
MSNVLLFGVLPYVALALAVAGGIYRYRRDRFSFSSLSSQFLENRSLFWGSVPWHYGIVILLLLHLIGLLIPDGVLAFNAVPLRLYILEITALALGLAALVGIALLLYRRLSNPRIRAVTSWMDIVLLVLLLSQVVLGVYTALFHRWGSTWYASNAAPYLISLVQLNPRVEYAATLPLATQLHVIGAFLLVAIYPFSRLVHIFTVPITYLWRPYINVIWNRRSR